jgi:hypothetical protein
MQKKDDRNSRFHPEGDPQPKGARQGEKGKLENLRFPRTVRLWFPGPIIFFPKALPWAIIERQISNPKHQIQNKIRMTEMKNEETFRGRERR